jgi:putative Mn2+ efflux pump MntP
LGDVGTALLFGLAANTDNLTVGTAYGVRQRGIPWEQNLFIGIVTTAVTLMALLAGRNVRAVLPAALPDWAGGILLIAMAAWGFYREQKAPGSWSDRHAPSTADLKVKTCESFLLAGALSWVRGR